MEPCGLNVKNVSCSLTQVDRLRATIAIPRKFGGLDITWWFVASFVVLACLSSRPRHDRSQQICIDDATLNCTAQAVAALACTHKINDNHNNEEKLSIYLLYKHTKCVLANSFHSFLFIQTTTTTRQEKKQTIRCKFLSLMSRLWTNSCP